MVIAVKPTKRQLGMIGSSTLVHVAELSRLALIVVDKTPPASQTIGENCTISLKAGQGWSATPFKLLRDYSVLDTDFTNLKDWGRYLYFFVGDPGKWAVFKNLDSFRSWEDICRNFAVIRISGAKLPAGSPVFFRPDDDVVVMRGDYTGPAAVTPAP